MSKKLKMKKIEKIFRVNKSGKYKTYNQIEKLNKPGQIKTDKNESQNIKIQKNGTIQKQKKRKKLKY